MKRILNNYRFGIILFSILILLTYLGRLIRPFQKINTKTVTLKADPKYDYKTYKRTSYWIDMYFYEIDDKMEIAGGDYRYLNHPRFLKEILKDTTVTIVYSGNNITQIFKKGFNYLEPEVSKKDWEQNANFARILLLTALLTCLIPYLLRSKIGEERFLSLSKNFALLIIPILIVVGLFTSLFFDNKLANSDWTKYPVEKRR